MAIRQKRERKAWRFHYLLHAWVWLSKWLPRSHDAPDREQSQFDDSSHSQKTVISSWGRKPSENGERKKEKKKEKKNKKEGAADLYLEMPKKDEETRKLGGSEKVEPRKGALVVKHRDFARLGHVHGDLREEVFWGQDQRQPHARPRPLAPPDETRWILRAPLSRPVNGVL